MSGLKTKTMRDALIDNIYKKMQYNERIFFLTADMGAPSLDKLRKDFKDRFINVGIAEQNLVNVATGLALEGFIVYAYAIAGFLTMRAYEQIRTNLALFSQQKAVNVNLVGVGTGVSYDMSGPSHHCLEDIAIIRTLPNIVFCSPSDWITAEKFVDFSVDVKRPKYIRLDSKPLPQIYEKNANFNWQQGFCELVSGSGVCIVSTGYATHKALQIAKTLQADGFDVGVIDVFMLKPINEDSLLNFLRRYKTVISIEEGFVNKGGLDSLISNVLDSRDGNIKLKRFGFADNYTFQSSSREILYEVNGLGQNDIIKAIKECEISSINCK